MCITKKELTEKVAEIRSLKTLLEETETLIKSLERDVIDFMTETEQKEYIGSDFKVTYKGQSRKTLDKSKLETVFGDLSDYEKVTTFDVLRIK